jgi:hypothetical protein
MPENETEIKLSKRRFLVLFTFVLLSMTNSYQWCQYASISDKIIFYYSNIKQVFLLLKTILKIENTILDRCRCFINCLHGTLCATIASCKCPAEQDRTIAGNVDQCMFECNW